MTAEGREAHRRPELLLRDRLPDDRADIPETRPTSADLRDVAAIMGWRLPLALVLQPLKLAY
jgi:hypothetical protein